MGSLQNLSASGRVTQLLIGLYDDVTDEQVELFCEIVRTYGGTDEAIVTAFCMEQFAGFIRGYLFDTFGWIDPEYVERFAQLYVDGLTPEDISNFFMRISYGEVVIDDEPGAGVG